MSSPPTSRIAAACLGALALAPAQLLAAPPNPSSARPAPAHAKAEPAGPRQPGSSRSATAELASGGILLGLGFAAELSGAIISSRCELGTWCAAGLSLTVGGADAPGRYTLISTGTSSTYVMGRLVAAPLLIGGFTLTMIGVARAGAGASSWSQARRRRLAWSLFGAGLGVLVVSRVLRAVFAFEGLCQDPLCVHGFDQSSLWVGRGLTFAGTGMLVQGAARRVELGLSGGPSQGFGLSISGRF